MREKSAKLVKDIALELFAGMLAAIGAYNVALYANLPLTGFTGVAMILFRLFGLPMGITTLLLNIPVVILAWRIIGRKFVVRSLRCMVIFAVCLDYLAPLLPVYQGDRMIAAILTGLFSGFGYGIVYANGGSTGGMDFVIMMIKRFRPHIPVGAISFTTDTIIVLVGSYFIQDLDSLVYGVLVAYLLSQVVDRIILGLNSGKMALIITDQGHAVCDLIDQCCMRGSTLIPAEGGYQGDPKEVVLVAGSNKDIYRVKKEVKTLDPASFVIILDSHQVQGEGFKITDVAGLED